MSRRPRPWALAILAATLLAYLPLFHAGFIWDDDGLLLDNKLVLAAGGLRRIWFSRDALDYWPITNSSFWLEWRLWGAHPLGYHLTNLTLHLLSVFLLWSILRRLRIPGAEWAALLMAVHPLNVESVAWIAQRKNLLAMVFALASIACWLRSGSAVAGVADPGGGPRKPSPPTPSFGWYAFSLLTFLLAMLSKGSVAPLPLVLLGIIAWHRRLTWRDAVRILPFLIVALILTAVNLAWSRLAPGEAVRTAGFLERLAGAGAILWFYLGRCLWPHPLLFVYPMWRINPSALAWWLPLLAAVLFTSGLIAWRRHPLVRAALAAWAYFVLMLIPVLGFTDVTFMKYSLVADHYAHLALVGVVAWLAYAAQLWRRQAPRVAGVLVAALTLLGAKTWAQCQLYRDNLTLFEASLEHNPDSWMAHTVVGGIWLHTPGRLDDAVAEFQRALQLNPGFATAHTNLGNAWVRIPGHDPDAIAEYRAALRIEPDQFEAHLNLGNVLARTPGRVPESLPEYRAALRIDPDSRAARFNLGLALRALGLDPTPASAAAPAPRPR